jgi:hypothetical protein
MLKQLSKLITQDIKAEQKLLQAQVSYFRGQALTNCQLDLELAKMKHIMGKEQK